MRLDEERAIRALPGMLPAGADQRREALDVLRGILRARGSLSLEDERRLRRIEGLFEAGPVTTHPKDQAVA